MNLVKRKISDTTDPEVWGSDFQEVAEDSGRVVALYSYNGEEPGTLQVQPGQQFRLIEYYWHSKVDKGPHAPVSGFWKATKEGG